MLRPISESLVFLLIAVIVLRTYAVEGYIISTGSMAPHLLGRHALGKCRACGFETAVGLSEDVADTRPLSWVCANCGLRQRSDGGVEASDGDQLLVAKQLPLRLVARRWRPVVFRNPADPNVPFVKRIAGLPGEALMLRDGDVWIDGRRIAKSLSEQRALRILVYDIRFAPAAGEDWQPRWVADDGVRRVAAGFRWDGPSAVSAEVGGDGVHVQDVRWVHYRHWIRSGGAHRTAVPLDGSLRPEIPNPVLSPVSFDPQRRVLECRGVMPLRVRGALLASNADPRIRAAVQRLAELSHWAPITDVLSYNGSPRVSPKWVRDIMVAAQVHPAGGRGAVLFRMTDGQRWFELAFDFRSREVRLSADDRSRVLWKAALRDVVRPATAFSVEFSVFDRHVVAGVDGRQLFPPIPIEVPGVEASGGSDAKEGAGPTVPGERGGRAASGNDGEAVPFDHPRRIVYIGVSGMECQIDQLRVYRDVYYRTDGVRNGDTPYRLGIDEYFMLGDNSAVSLDSRLWERAGVPASMFIGRPLVVHLPSRTVRCRLGPWTGRFRVPDLSRVRYIH